MTEPLQEEAGVFIIVFRHLILKRSMVFHFWKALSFSRWILFVSTNLMLLTSIPLVAQPTKKVELHRGVLLKWKAIPGADFYRIEISDTKDFSHPDMVVQVRGLKYFWTGFKTNNIYYFRVAAGSDDGAKGPFSAPRKVDLANLVFKPTHVKQP